MYSTIVVGTDGSDRAHDAVRRAGEVASASGVTAIHVVSACVPYSGDEMQRIREGLPKEFHDLVDPYAPARDHISAASTILAGTKIEVIGHEVTGDPSNAILDVAAEVHADLVVVGARGLGALERFARGSVSTRVAHHSKCDVLIVEHDN